MQQSKVIMGFDYEYTYHDHEYIIKIMNTKPAQCTYYNYIQHTLYIGGFSAPSCTQDCTQSS